MATASLAQVATRTDRASGIVAAGGVVELEAQPGTFVVFDAATGSGRGHVATLDSCDCKDHVYRGRICKHMIAARTAAGHEVCPTCGAILESGDFHVGGTGYVTVVYCPADKAHFSRRG